MPLKVVRLKAEHEKQEKLKRNYRDQRDSLQTVADDVVKRKN